jgi:hypothetical protein
LYAGSYWLSVQISNRKETARNSHRDTSLWDTLAKGQAISSRKRMYLHLKKQFLSPSSAWLFAADCVDF